MATKQFNKKLHDDVIKLKKMRDEKPEGYREFFNTIQQKYKLSTTSLYREMAKEKPGIPKAATVRKRSMKKISKRELDRLAGLIVEKKKHEEILAEMSGFMGFEYSPGRLAAARHRLQLAADEITGRIPKVVHHFYDPKTIDGLKISNVSTLRPDGKEGAFPQKLSLPKFTGDASKLFYELAKIDISKPDSINKIEFRETVHYVHTTVIKECLDHIAASSVSGGGTISVSLKFSLETLLRGQLDKARRRGYLTSSELQQFTSVLKKLQTFEKEPRKKGGCYTFDEVMHIVSVFSPSISREKLSNIIANHPFLNRPPVSENPRSYTENDTENSQSQ